MLTTRNLAFHWSVSEPSVVHRGAERRVWCEILRGGKNVKKTCKLMVKQYDKCRHKNHICIFFLFNSFICLNIMYFVPRILGGVDQGGSGTSIMAP